eukprot:scaffold64168_cov78-Attheya_sp.AAC.6
MATTMPVSVHILRRLQQRGGGGSAIRNGRVVRGGHDEGTQYKQLIFVFQHTFYCCSQVVQSAFRVSTALRLPLRKEGQTYGRWL